MSSAPLDDPKFLSAFGVYWRRIWEEEPHDSETYEKPYAAWERLFAEPMPSLRGAQQEAWGDTVASKIGTRLRVCNPEGYSLWVLV